MVGPEKQHRGEAPPGGSGKSSLAAWRWPLALVAVVLVLALAAFLAYRETLERAERAAGTVGELAGSAAEKAREIAAGFWTGDVTERFTSSLPTIVSAGGGRLEVATLEATETFSRADEVRMFWDQVSLGTTVTEIAVPVTYRYHVRLDDAWRVEIRDGVCSVYAPRLRPSQPPAIDTSKMEKHVTSGWLRFDDEEQLTALERSITPRLTRMAGDRRRILLVRDEARRTLGEFVKTWLLREEQWADDGVRTVEVVFPDEVEVDAGRRGPEVVLEE